MKFIHINTASAFASDYKPFGYQANPSNWESIEVTPIEIWEKYCPSGLAVFRKNLNLGYRNRSFSMWICRNDLGPGHFCAITITGMASEIRKDFMGRIIYDSLSLIRTNNQNRCEQDLPSFACDQVSIALNALDAFSSKNWSLDRAANQDDFDRDIFAFSDIGRVYSLLSVRRERDIRAGLSEESGVAHKLVLELLRRLDIDFSIEEAAPDKGSEFRPAQLRCESLGDTIDSMTEVAEEIKEELEDRVVSILGEKSSQVLFKPFRVIEGLLKRGSSAQQIEDSKSGSRRGAEEGRLRSGGLYIKCKNRPSLDTASRLQSGLFNIWENNPSVAIGFSIACPEGEPSSTRTGANRQGEFIIVEAP
jgi:hypothetical protein